MVRYLIISILIHFSFVALLNYQPNSVIENPIYSVEFLETTQAATSKSSGTMIKKVAIAPVELKKSEDSASTSQESPSQDSNGQIEIQQVTKMPRVLRQVKAEYPESAKQARIEGAVKLSVLVDSTGSVTEVLILEGPGHGLNETAQKALMNFQFSPAEKQGQKVSVKITYIYRFRLDSR